MTEPLNLAYKSQIERAEAKAREIVNAPYTPETTGEGLEGRIARALMEVRNEALEEAAEFCDVYHAMNGDGLAAGIRALKSEAK